MAKPASGGKRAVEKKHAQREAARMRDGNWREQWIAKVDALEAPPKTAEAAHEWLGRAAVLIVEATLRDTAIPPEQMRRDAMRQIEQASKVLDPAKLSEQLSELETALEELRANATHVETGEDSPATTGADLC